MGRQKEEGVTGEEMTLYTGNRGKGSQCLAGDRQVSGLRAHSSQLSPPTPIMVPTPHQTEQDPQDRRSCQGTGGHRKGLVSPQAPVCPS